MAPVRQTNREAETRNHALNANFSQTKNGEDGFKEAGFALSIST